MNIQVTKSDNRTNFKWLVGTHKEITNFVVADFPKFVPYSRELAHFSQMPDFDESLPRFTGKLFGNNHHYRPNSNNDLHAYYIMHTQAMLTALKEGNMKKVVEHAGRIVHFLGDAAMYLHVVQHNPAEEFASMPFHVMIEGFAQTIQSRFLSTYKNKKVPHHNYDEIFMRNIAFSQEQAQTCKGKSWEKIVNAGLERAVDSTREFLTLTSYLIKV